MYQILTMVLYVTFVSLMLSKLEFYVVNVNMMIDECVCYDRDNAKVCSCGGDSQVYYWDVSTGRVIRKFHGHDGEAIFPGLWLVEEVTKGSYDASESAET